MKDWPLKEEPRKEGKREARMLLDKIKTDLTAALKQKEETKSSTLRFLLAAIQNKEIELKKRGQLTDEEVVAVIQKQVEEHQESIDAYKKGNREDLVKKEEAELAILKTYLPQELPPSELEKIVKATIQEVKASGPQDFGKVMGAVIAKVKGRADGKTVAETVKRLL